MTRRIKTQIGGVNDTDKRGVFGKAFDKAIDSIADLLNIRTRVLKTEMKVPFDNQPMDIRKFTTIRNISNLPNKEDRAKYLEQFIGNGDRRIQRNYLAGQINENNPNLPISKEFANEIGEALVKTAKDANEYLQTITELDREGKRMFSSDLFDINKLTFKLSEANYFEIQNLLRGTNDDQKRQDIAMDIVRDLQANQEREKIFQLIRNCWFTKFFVHLAFAATRPNAPESLNEEEGVIVSDTARNLVSHYGNNWSNANEQQRMNMMEGYLNISWLLQRTTPEQIKNSSAVDSLKYIYETTKGKDQIEHIKNLNHMLGLSLEQIYKKCPNYRPSESALEKF